MRPTYVRASVGSRTSGSSARPIRSVVCAEAIALDRISNAAAAARRNVFIGPLPSSSRLFNFINIRAGLPIRPVPKSIHELLQCRREATPARNDVRSRRQLAGAVAGGRVRTSDEFRPFGLTARDSDRASGMEWASRWRMQRARHLSAQDDPFALGARHGHRNGGEKCAAVGVPRICEQSVVGSDLDDAAEMHYRNAVGNVLHHREIVRNEFVGQPEPPLQVAQEIEHLRTDRDIERRNRLVTDDELGLDCERARNGDALALAAGEFMRITARQARLEADKPQKLVHPLRAARWRDDVVQRKRLGENLPDGHARIERGIGVLEDELCVAAQRPELTLLEGRDISTVETDASCRWFDQPQHQPAEGRFATAGFADEREGFAGLERKAHPIHGGYDGGRTAENRATRDELAADVLDLEQRRAHDRICSSGARMQRDAWPGPTGTIGGGACVQISRTNGQRGANRHPVGSAAMFGTMPSMAASSSTLQSSRGMEPRRPIVYGCCGAANSTSTGARSTISPAYMTATSSQTSATPPRSWVMRMIAASVAAFRSRMRSRICACMVTSSAVVGS